MDTAPWGCLSLASPAHFHSWLSWQFLDHTALAAAPVMSRGHPLPLVYHRGSLFQVLIQSGWSLTFQDDGLRDLALPNDLLSN